MLGLALIDDWEEPSQLDSVPAITLLSRHDRHEVQRWERLAQC